MEELRGGLPILFRNCLVELFVELVRLELGLAGWEEGYRKETPSMSLLTMRIIKYDNEYRLDLTWQDYMGGDCGGGCWWAVMLWDRQFVHQEGHTGSNEYYLVLYEWLREKFACEYQSFLVAFWICRSKLGFFSRMIWLILANRISAALIFYLKPSYLNLMTSSNF